MIDTTIIRCYTAIVTGQITSEGRRAMKKITRLLTVIMLISVIAGLAGCGKKSEKITAMVDDSAVSRELSDEGDVHYIDDNAIALAAGAATTATAAEAQATLALVNVQRAAAGLAELVWNEGLEQAAQVRAQECERAFSHTRPDGTDWWTVNSALMYGENLAMNYNDSNSVVNAWMASPGHKANILNGGYASIGVAAYQAPNGSWDWAQEFGY